MPIDLGGLLGVDFIQNVAKAYVLCTISPVFLGLILSVLCTAIGAVCGGPGLLCCGVGGLPGILLIALGLLGCGIPTGVYMTCWAAPSSACCTSLTNAVISTGQQGAGISESCPLFAA